MKKTSVLLVFVLILTSCGSSFLKNYENISKTKKSYNKIIVIGRSSDQISRIKFEDNVVNHLKEEGVEAVASYKIDITKNIQKDFSEAEVNAIEKELLAKGIDGSIITNFINSEKYQEVIPGNSSTNYYPVRYGRFGRAWGYYPISTWEPDQIQVGVKYLFETSFYKLNENDEDNLQWLGRFEVKDPSDLNKIATKYAKELVTKLVKESIEK